MTRLRALLLSSLLVPAGAAAAQDLSTIPLPDIAPDQIALDSGTDWVNGLEVLRAPRFWPWESGMRMKHQGAAPHKLGRTW